MNKFCKFCKQDKDPELFPRNNATKDGRDNRCKECWKIYSAMKRGKVLHGNKFSKQAPVHVEPVMETVPNGLLQPISSLSKLPGTGLRDDDGNPLHVEWSGSVLEGLKGIQKKFGRQPQVVYQFKNRYYVEL